jgi:hypothetical protein
MPQEESSARKEKSDVLKQTYFNVNDENAITVEYFNLSTNAA